MKTISIPVNNRPDMLRRVLKSIADADHHEGWQLVFSCEPGVHHLPKGAFVSTNSSNRGCWVNTFLAADFAMGMGSDLNLYLEDDYLITPDSLVMVEQWACSNNPGVLCLRRPHSLQEPSAPDVVSPITSGLFGCGFAWRSEMWGMVRQGWFSEGVNGYQMWDLSIDRFFKDMLIPQWRPMINRSLGIGLIGTHPHGAGEDLHLFGPCYTGEPVKTFKFL